MTPTERERATLVFVDAARANDRPFEIRLRLLCKWARALGLKTEHAEKSPGLRARHAPGEGT